MIAVKGGAVVTDVTLPFIGALQFPNIGGVLSAIWLVGLMNVVNFSDGVDGLAAGVCAIDGMAFSIIAFDLGVNAARGSSPRPPRGRRSASCSTISIPPRCSWATPAPTCSAICWAWPRWSAR